MRVLQSLGCLTPAAIVIYGVVGLLLLGQFSNQALNYLRTMGWQQLPGTIISSQVDDQWDTAGDRYAGLVIYSYELNGVAYRGDQIDLRGPIYVRSRETAEQLLAPYPVGASVMLYVDPTDPTRAVLDRTVPGAIWGIVGIGSTLFLLSLVLGIRHFMVLRQSPKTP